MKLKPRYPLQFEVNSKTDALVEFIYYDEDGEELCKVNVIFEYAQTDASTVEVYVLFAMQDFKDQVEEAIKSRVVKKIHWTGNIIFSWL